MKTRNLILVGVAVFVVSLVLGAPVALLYAKLVPAPGGGVVPMGLSGSLSEGRSAALMLNGRPLLKDLHWRLRPLFLLLGRASFHVDSSSELTLDGKAAALATGGLNLDALRAAGPLKQLLTLSGDVGVPVDGQFGLKLDSARIRSGFLSSADGELTISGLRWTLAKDPVPLGDYLLRVATDKGVITGKLEPLSGPIEAGGELRLTAADRSFEIDLQVRAKPGADALVQNLVRSLGQPDTQGYFHVRNAGHLGGAPIPAPGAAVPNTR